MRKTVIALTVAATAIIALAGVTRLRQADQGEEGIAPPEVVQRGKYMVSVMGCNDCHTPWKMGPKGPEPDMERFLSGHPEQIGPVNATQPGEPFLWAGLATNTAFTGPWGVSYTANLTPDRNTGLGIWTEDMFVRAIRTGRHMGTSRPINPPMPWPAYRNATDEDLKAVFAFLRTIKPIVNHVPEYQPPAEGGSSNN